MTEYRKKIEEILYPDYIKLSKTSKDKVNKLLSLLKSQRKEIDNAWRKRIEKNIEVIDILLKNNHLTKDRKYEILSERKVLNNLLKV